MRITSLGVSLSMHLTERTDSQLRGGELSISDRYDIAREHRRLVNVLFTGGTLLNKVRENGEVLTLSSGRYHILVKGEEVGGLGRRRGTQESLSLSFGD